jgi:hypothetical protein
MPATLCIFSFVLVIETGALPCALHLTTFELMGSRQHLRLGFLKTSF